MITGTYVNHLQYREEQALLELSLIKYKTISILLLLVTCILVVVMVAHIESDSRSNEINTYIQTIQAQEIKECKGDDHE